MAVITPWREDLVGLVIHETEPRVGGFHSAKVILEAQPRLVAVLLYQLAQSPHLERCVDVLALVAVQKLVPRVGLNTASVLCVSPVGNGDFGAPLPLAVPVRCAGRVFPAAGTVA